MARKIHIDSDNTLQQWIDSQNTMSDYMGNLDSFRSDILDNFVVTPHNSSTGASFVTALNYLYDPLMQKLLNLFNGTGSTNFDKLELRVDSGTFNILRLDMQDSTVGKNLLGRSTLFAADAHVRDSYEDGDSIGSTNLIASILSGYVHLIPDFNYDLYIESNAAFRNIVVESSFDASLLDSAKFNKITIVDSSRVDKLIADSNGTVTISQTKVIDFHPGQPDSGNIGFLVNHNLVADSAVFLKASINNLTIDSDLIFDNHTFTEASKFLITDSSSPDTSSDPGEIYLGGFKLDSV
jgi:hypothetical protein